LKASIRAKIDAALAARDNPTPARASTKIDTASAKLIANAVIDNGEKLWSIAEVADRTSHSWGKVRRDLAGQIGFLDFDGDYRITDSLFRRYLIEAATRGQAKAA
jgi:hypothetical protein